MRPRNNQREFGLSLGAVSCLIAALAAWRGHALAARLWLAIGATLLALGLAWPACLRAPAAAWMRLARLLGWINSRALLTLFFAFVITPVGWALRLVGWDPMRRRQGRDETQWTAYPASHHDAAHYERMY